MSDEKISLEVYFLRYAFPCSFVTLQRGRISEKEYEDLEQAAKDGRVIPRERLEEIFVPAFKRLAVLADEMGKPVWNYEVMRDYFLRVHNEIIEEGRESYATAPPMLKELCRIDRAKVIKVVGDDGAVVQFSNGKTRSVMTDLVDDVKVGDEVMIHYGYICEKAD